MARRDVYHDAVRRALEKDGWQITHDPLSLRIDDIPMQIDLAAERLITAERKGEKIAVEVKSFLRDSAISEFHTALGQFINYRDLLEIKEPDRILFLAAPVDTYKQFFRLDFIQDRLIRYAIRVLVYDPKAEEVVSWQA